MWLCVVWLCVIGGDGSVVLVVYLVGGFGGLGIGIVCGLCWLVFD